MKLKPTYFLFPDLKEIIKELSEEDKDILYRVFWQEKIAEDISAYIEDWEILDIDEKPINSKKLNLIISSASYNYTQGDYDCNISYWDNIENVVSKEIKKQNCHLIIGRYENAS